MLKFVFRKKKSKAAIPYLIHRLTLVWIGCSCLRLPLFQFLICSFCGCLNFLASSPILSPGLLREVLWHKQERMWVEDEVGGTAQACLPWVEHLPGGRDPPAGSGSLLGCPPSQQDHGSMLSTTMVGTLVRGWRNRSSPRRAESKLPTPQRQGGIRIQGMLLMLWCGWITF